MDFRLTEEQELLREMAKKFTHREIIPHVERYEQAERFPEEIGRSAFDNGLLTAQIPEIYGGGGMGVTEGCIIGEEIAAGDVGIATSIGVASLGTYPIVIAGSDELKARFLKSFCERYTMSALCVTEPGAGSDVISMSTTAVRDGDYYILNGTKAWITNATIADFYTVFACTDKALKHKGISCFVVPRDTKGVTPGKHEIKMGQRSSDTAAVTFDNVRIPAAQRVGAEGDGFKLLMQTFDKSRPAVGAWSVGLARAAFDYALTYSKDRKQFGKPIGEFQAVQFMLAEMARDIDAARLMTQRAAWMIDHGIRNTMEASMAKSFASDVAMKVTTMAVQVYGGYGYSREYPVEKLMRDAKVLQIYEGTNQIQLLIIARALLS